jgi:hypothetical protein
VRNIGTRIAIAWLLVATLRSGAQTPPPNDNFTNRILLTGSDVSFSGTLAGASRETNPYEITGDAFSHPQTTPTQTVWWQWTPTQSSTVIIEIESASKGSFEDDGLVVYSNLTSIDTGEAIAGMTIYSRVPHLYFTFNATAGVNYQFQLVGSDSASFNFRLVATNTPFILIPPRTQTVTVNDSVLFGAIVAGAKPFGFQWQFNGTNLPGETVAMLALENVTLDQAGDYRLLITNASGSTLSDPVHLFVTPTDTAPILSAQPSTNADQFAFGLPSEIGRRYRVESSVDFFNWSAEKTFPRMGSIQAYSGVDVIESTGTNRFSLVKADQQKFVRAYCFHAQSEVCNVRLKQIRFAQQEFLYDHNVSPYDASTFEDLFPYMKNGGYIYCPNDGSYVITDFSTNPQCSYHSYPNSFEEP